MKSSMHNIVNYLKNIRITGKKFIDCMESRFGGADKSDLRQMYVLNKQKRRNS
jgi:hypothetical protein